MTQTLFVSNIRLSSFLNRRWLMILVGLLGQCGVIVAILLSIRHPALSDVTLVSVGGNSTVCRVEAVEPFTDAWIRGVQSGSLVQAVGPSTTLKNCKASDQLSQLQVEGQNRSFSVTTAPEALDLTNTVLAGVLAVVFSLTGMAIFLRASDRPLASITYALFYVSSLMFCLLNVHSFNYLWINMLLFFLMMLTRGLSTTFVCLFPHPSLKPEGRRRMQVLPYIPLAIGVVLEALSLPMFIVVPQVRMGLLIVIFCYNIACLVVVIWVLFWGLRTLNRNDRQLIRMVAVGVIFLLLPLAFGLNVVRTETLVKESLIRLIPIPLAVLPIACDYALFRHQLLGTTSLLSRRVMRVLLWLLLASLFIFPCIILLRYINAYQEGIRDYLYAGLLALSLCLFPLVWNKVRDVGDQVFYRDFYQYNRSLRELSADLTRLQGLDQISSFVLPRLVTLLNATDAALLIRTTSQEEIIFSAESRDETSEHWRIYHHAVSQPGLSPERLRGVANLALTHVTPPSYKPLLLDNILLLALYDGKHLSGFLCLGPKMNLEPYSRQDASFLTTLTSQLSVLEVNNRYLVQAQSDAQKLSALNRRVVSAQEDERRHLALDLHDEVLQQAMLLVRQLSDAGSMSDVAEVMPLARSVVTSLRQTCLELRPPLLDELGLEEALYWLACQTEQHSSGGMKIEASCEGLCDMRPSPQVELAFYRVGQEALSNVLKYAGAKQVVMRLRYDTHGGMSLVVRDNGRGFKKGQLLVESLGLVGMRERMVAIGGRLQLRTGPGQGTTIRATYTPSAREINSSVALYHGTPEEVNEQQVNSLVQEKVIS